MKYSSSAPVVNSRKALHASLLKNALHYRYFSKNVTVISEQWYWKIHFDDYFRGQYLHILHIFYIFYRDVTLKRNRFSGIFLSKRFTKKYKHTELTLFNILFKNSNLFKETHSPFILVEYQHRDPAKSCF